MAGFRVSLPYIFGGIYNVTPPSASDGQSVPLQTDSAGNLKVTFTGGSASNPAASSTGAAVPSSASYNGVNVGGILLGQTGFSLNAGASVPAAVAIVDGSGNQITSFGGGTQYADAAASGAHPTGTQVIGWNKGGSLELAITAAPLTNAQALHVAVVDGSGNQITSFGGGTQYADNAASGATPTGTLNMGWDGINSKIRALKVDTNQNLLVQTGLETATGSTWDSSTPLNTVQYSNGTAVIGLPSGGASVGLAVVTSNGTFSAGQLTFEISYDGVTWALAPFVFNTAGSTWTSQTSLLTLSSNTATNLIILPSGAQNIRVRLSQAIIGTGTVSFSWNVGGQSFPVVVANSPVVSITGVASVKINSAGIGGTIGSPLWSQITDSTNGPVAVKAASTAAVVADPSLVVALSPNTPVSLKLGGSTGFWTGLNLAGINPGAVVIADSTGNGAYTVVKPASTAPVATDPALVVAISPNTTAFPVTADAGQTVSGTMNSGGFSLVLALTDLSRSVSASFNPGTLSGAVAVTFSQDGGNNYQPTSFYQYTSGLPKGLPDLTSFVNTVTFSFSIATQWGIILPAGTTHVKIAAISYTSGSGTISLHASPAPPDLQFPIVQGGAASGAAKFGYPVQIGGVFNTTQPTVASGSVVEAQATSHGALIIASGSDSVFVAQGARQGIAGAWSVAISDHVNSIVKVAQLRSNAIAIGDGNQQAVNPRAGKYTEQQVLSVIPTKHNLGVEGSYFTANNGQTAMATAAAAPTAFTATTPFAIVYNNASSANTNAPQIFLDYLHLVTSAAPTATTSVQMAIVRDTVNRFSALGTGGIAATPIKCNSGGPASVAQVWMGGQLTATAASSNAQTVVGNRLLRGTIPIIWDTYTIQFGSVDSTTTVVATAAVASNILVAVPPMILNPDECGLIYLWYPGMTAAQSFLPEIGWFER